MYVCAELALRPCSPHKWEQADSEHICREPSTAWHILQDDQFGGGSVMRWGGTTQTSMWLVEVPLATDWSSKVQTSLNQQVGEEQRILSKFWWNLISSWISPVCCYRARTHWRWNFPCTENHFHRGGSLLTKFSWCHSGERSHCSYVGAQRCKLWIRWIRLSKGHC